MFPKLSLASTGSTHCFDDIVRFLGGFGEQVQEMFEHHVTAGVGGRRHRWTRKTAGKKRKAKEKKELQKGDKHNHKSTKEKIWEIRYPIDGRTHTGLELCFRCRG
jgi:hypothetical protein